MSLGRVGPAENLAPCLFFFYMEVKLGYIKRNIQVSIMGIVCGKRQYKIKKLMGTGLVGYKMSNSYEMIILR